MHCISTMQRGALGQSFSSEETYPGSSREEERAGRFRLASIVDEKRRTRIAHLLSRMNAPRRRQTALWVPDLFASVIAITAGAAGVRIESGEKNTGS
jgi:hypothetical protein